MRLNTACMDKVRTHGYYVMTRVYNRFGSYSLEQQYIEDTSSKLCRSHQDIPKVGPCKGCQLEQDHEYFTKMGLK